jgi:hypothetical protein
MDFDLFLITRTQDLRNRLLNISERGFFLHRGDPRIAETHFQKQHSDEGNAKAIDYGEGLMLRGYGIYLNLVTKV